MTNTFRRCIQIANSHARAQVYPERGFQLLGFQVQSAGSWVETIHAPDQDIEPSDRRYGNPLLFPAVGVSNGTIADAWDHGGQPLAMPPHGWARNVYWQVTDVEAESVTAVLVPHPGFKLAFPFDFRLSARYRLEGATLRLDVNINNLGADPFPYALGFHPYLAAGADARVALPAGTRLRTPDGWRSHTREPFAARRIDLRDPQLPSSILLADTGAKRLGVLDTRTKRTTWVSIEDSVCDYPVWVIWNAGPQAPYVCLEPWTDAPNALNRSGTRRLQPGESHAYQMALELEAP